MLAITIGLASACFALPAQEGARVVERNGVPTLEINGQPFNGMARNGYNDKDFPIFGPLGVKLYFPTFTAGQGFWMPPTWLGPGRWDYSRIDSALDNLFAKVSDAQVILKLSESAPDWWREKHPGELVQIIADGKTVPLKLPRTDQAILKAHPETVQRTVPSMASPLWRHDVSAAIVHLMHHLEAKPYAKQIVGYLICSGEGYNEWFSWGFVPDHSPANVAGFRAWLKGHYTKVAEIKAAWHDPNVSFENALPPDEAAVTNTDFGALRDPEKEMPVIDYLNYNSFLIASTVDTIAHIIKQNSPRQILVGAYFGYLTASDPRWGHQDVGMLLRSTNMDFLCSPSAYWEHRDLGVAAPESMGALGSVRLHGKYWFNENDHVNSFTVPDASWGKQAANQSIARDIIIQRRELGWTIASGIGQWWQDVGRIRYDQPAMLSAISNCTAIANACLDVSRKPLDEAAAVVDPESIYYIKPGDYMLKRLRRLQIDKLTRSGMASEVYSSDDIPNLQDKRLVLFCDLIAPSPKLRAAINGLKSNGRVLVFLWGAGSMRDGHFDPEAMQKLTGINIKCPKDGRKLQVVTTKNAGPDLAGVTYGVTDLVSPAFVPEAADADVWGKLDSGEPALVVKKYPTWTAVYSAAPMIAPEILAKLGKIADIYQYAPPGDALWATEGMVAVTAFSSGQKQISFPQPVKLFDCYQGMDLGRGSQFQFSMTANETKLFRLEK